MNGIARIGTDTAKNVFQPHGVNSAEETVLRRQMRRREMIQLFEKLPPALVAVEACGSSHYWGRLLRSFGHDVRLIPPQYVKAYVKRGKNDAADAEALCEAVSRPSMRFVPIKSEEQQAACMLMSVRDRLVDAAEFGIEYTAIVARLEQIENKLMAWHREDVLSRRIASIPGVGRRCWRSKRRQLRTSDPPGISLHGLVQHRRTMLLGDVSDWEASPKLATAISGHYWS